MAKIYGLPGTLRSVLLNIPEFAKNKVNTLQDIKALLVEYEEDLANRERDFYKNLPERKKEKESEISKAASEREEELLKWKWRIEDAKNDIDYAKNSKKIIDKLSLPVKYTKLLLRKNIEPVNFKKAKKHESVRKNELNTLDNNPGSIFLQENKEIIYQHTDIKKIARSLDYIGAEGEMRVLELLKEIDGVVFCDINIDLDGYVTFRGVKNLKSAQIDFVLVNKKGVFCIEVKNWSRSYYDHSIFKPHEQAAREAAVAYFYLKDRLNYIKPRVNSILVDLNKHMKYDPDFKYVWVTHLQGLKHAIYQKEIIYCENDVVKIGRIFENLLKVR